MFYDVSITVPANTTESLPVSEIVKVTYGVITRVSFRPRPGHAGLCHVRVFYHEHQLFPVGRNEDLHGDTYPIEWDEYEELFTEPYELKVVAWNDDDTYEHTFDIGFVILPRSAIIALAIVDAIKGILGLLSPKRILFGG